VLQGKTERRNEMKGRSVTEIGQDIVSLLQRTRMQGSKLVIFGVCNEVQICNKPKP
jgi:hypothetical protein